MSYHGPAAAEPGKYYFFQDILGQDWISGFAVVDDFGNLVCVEILTFTLRGKL